MSKDALVRLGLTMLGSICAQIMATPNLPTWANILVTALSGALGGLSPSMFGIQRPIKDVVEAPKA